jgi:hypothetical protein
VTGPDSGRREYAFTPWIVRNGGIVVAVVLGMAAITVYGLVSGDLQDTWQYAGLGAIAVAAFAWTTARNLVLSATLQGGRLRARTATTRHEVAVADLTEISWRVGENRLGSLNPLNLMTARLRHRGRTLRVPMPVGGTLLRDLEAARSGGTAADSRPGGGSGDGQVREFDFTSWAETGWALQDTVIQYATLDDRCLRAATVDGREHTLHLADIDEVDHGRRPDGGQVMVHHSASGETLRIPMPSGAELADRLTAALPAP